MIRSVIASLLSLAALGKLVIGLLIFAMFYKVSLLSLKNLSILSLSLIILSVIIVLLSELSLLFSVIADDADPYLLLSYRLYLISVGVYIYKAGI
jgi:hypothetical protein